MRHEAAIVKQFVNEFLEAYTPLRKERGGGLRFQRANALQDQQTYKNCVYILVAIYLHYALSHNPASVPGQEKRSNPQYGSCKLDDCARIDRSQPISLAPPFRLIPYLLHRTSSYP